MLVSPKCCRPNVAVQNVHAKLQAYGDTKKNAGYMFCKPISEEQDFKVKVANGRR